MILYKCDFCKKIYGEKKIQRLAVGKSFERDEYDICDRCVEIVKKKASEEKKETRDTIYRDEALKEVACGTDKSDIQGRILSLPRADWE